jgi:protein TonB
MGKLVCFLIVVGFFVMSLGLVSNFFALDPRQLRSPASSGPKPVPIKIAEAKKEAPRPREAPKPILEKSLRALAPESSRDSLKELGGVGFGGSGTGLAIGGSGGFGTGVADIVNERGANDRSPRALSRNPPEYPPLARQKGLSGFVVLKIFVDRSGIVEDVKIAESVPGGIFDQAAILAVRAWKFDPAIKNGQVVAEWATQKVKFELN